MDTVAVVFAIVALIAVLPGRYRAAAVRAFVLWVSLCLIYLGVWWLIYHVPTVMGVDSAEVQTFRSCASFTVVIPVWLLWVLVIPIALAIIAFAWWVICECLYQSFKTCRLAWWAVAFYAHKQGNILQLKRAIAMAEREPE
jgi:hypothetical protein